MEEKKPNQCVVQGCELDRYERHDKCVLHCDKGAFSDNDVTKFLKTLFDNIYEAKNIKEVNNRTFYFSGICFPSIGFNTQNISLIKYSFLRFACKKALHKNSVRILFDCCTFINYSCVFSCFAKDIVSLSVEFRNCKFSDEVSLIPYTNINIQYTNSAFSGLIKIQNLYNISNYAMPTFSFCNGINSILLRDLIISCQFIFQRDTNANQSELQEYAKSDNSFRLIDYDIIDFQDSMFKIPIYICSTIITSLSINDSTFDKNFTIDGTNIVYSNIFNSVFNSTFSIYSSTFENILGLVNISFESNVYIRSTTFETKLDLLPCSFNKELDVSDLEIDLNNANRETFRILKHSSDKIGNTIEANKFFALEMKAYERELKENGGTKAERFLLWVNRTTSDYGQNYIKPILCIIPFAIAFYIITLLYEKQVLYRIAPKYNTVIEFIPDTLNGVAKSIIPLKHFLVPGIEFLSLIFGVIFAILIYQTIVALKRKTRR